MTVMPDRTSILVNVTGFPWMDWPVGGGVGLVLPPLMRSQLVVDDAWRAGSGNVKYATADGQWVSIADATVRRVPTRTAESLTVPGDLRVELHPAEVSASWSEGRLVIHASGKEDGVTDIHVEESPMTIYPPEFAVVGRLWPRLGTYPYAVTGVFALGTPPSDVLFSGQKVPVTVVGD